MQSGEVTDQGQGEWAQTIVFVSKKDGCLRFSVDYRKHKMLKSGNCTQYFVRKNELIHQEKLSIFQRLSQTAEPGRSRLKKKIKKKQPSLPTVHCITQMPFCLQNSPGTSQRTLDAAESAAKWLFALVYRDDILVLSCSPAEKIGLVGHASRCYSKQG